MEFITYTVENRVATITLNRPDKRNAFNAGLVTELKEAFKKADFDENVRVVLLKANGQVFSAGADLAYLIQMRNYQFDQNVSDNLAMAELFKSIYQHSKVVVAQVEGHALAGGCGLATVCDFTFAVPEALFGYTEVKIGFIPAIVMVFLIRKIGEGKAKELLLSGKMISAEEAQHYGLINKVVAADKISETVNNFIHQLVVECSGDALRITKEMIAHVQNLNLDDAIRYAAEMNAHSRTTKDCIRGIDSFLNREKIEW